MWTQQAEHEHTYETAMSLMLQIWQASVFTHLTQPHTCLDNSLSLSRLTNSNSALSSQFRQKACRVVRLTMEAEEEAARRSMRADHAVNTWKLKN